MSSLCNYSDAYILVKGFITVANNTVVAQLANNSNKNVVFKTCPPFTTYISRINNRQVDDAHDIDLVMPMYHLREYSKNYSKSSGILEQYCKDDDGDIVGFNAADATADSFKVKENIKAQTGNNGRKNVEIMKPLKYLSNIWRTLELPLINCKINLDLNWSKKRNIADTDLADKGATFSITDATIFVPVVTLSTQDNAKLIEQLKSGFKRAINWNKYK